LDEPRLTEWRVYTSLLHAFYVTQVIPVFVHEWDRTDQEDESEANSRVRMGLLGLVALALGESEYCELHNNRPNIALSPIVFRGNSTHRPCSELFSIGNWSIIVQFAVMMWMDGSPLLKNTFSIYFLEFQVTHSNLVVGTISSLTVSDLSNL
jgi:hypothetical protein